jgi:hypothetical protein
MLRMSPTIARQPGSGRPVHRVTMGQDVLRGKTQRLDASRRRRPGSGRLGPAGGARGARRRPLEGGERLDLRGHAGPPVLLFHALPQLSRACQGHPAQAGPPEYLPADRRQLYAVLSGHPARSLGLVAARGGVGARRSRRSAGTVAAQRGADPVGGDLRGHGLGGGGGVGSLAAGPGDGGIHLACGGRRADGVGTTR